MQFHPGNILQRTPKTISKIPSDGATARSIQPGRLPAFQIQPIKSPVVWTQPRGWGELQASLTSLPALMSILTCFTPPEKTTSLRGLEGRSSPGLQPFLVKIALLSLVPMMSCCRLGAFWICKRCSNKLTCVFLFGWLFFHSSDSTAAAWVLLSQVGGGKKHKK